MALHLNKASVGLPALAAVAALQWLSLPAQANEALAQKNNCLGCHAVATKLVGPAYKDVAAKYAGQSDAQIKLMESIRNGSAGKWGDMPMPPNPKIADADLKRLAVWVLSAK